MSLIELLVVIAIIALLVAVLLPSLMYARIAAKRVTAHSDLRQITIALDSYMIDNKDRVPPARSACGTDVNNQLPIELATGGYLPKSGSNIPQADVRDIFATAQSYKYIAPGAIWFNGSFFDQPDQPWRPRARVWVPNDFPSCETQQGQFFGGFPGEGPSPVVYAVWSIGPNPQSKKFPRWEGTGDVDMSRFPLVAPYWMKSSWDDGLIVHFKPQKRNICTTP